MKRRSVAGFVTGLVGILLAIPVFILAWYLITLIVGLPLSLAGNEIFADVVTISTSIAFSFSIILAIVGVCFYFDKAKIGGILMLIATLLGFTPYILAFIGIFSAGSNALEILISLVLYTVVGNIPTILMLISAILGLKAKATAQIIDTTNTQEQ